MFAKLTYQELDRQLEKFWVRCCAKRCEDRRIPVVVDPDSGLEQLDLEGIYFPVRTLKEKILLALLQWYFPEELSVQINLWLEEHWGPEHKDEKSVLNSSKSTALGWLLVQERWNEHDFFGNILKEENVRNILKFKYLRSSFRRAPRRTIRRRGYNDKGTLRLPHQTHYYDHRKFRSYEEQLEVETQQTEEIRILTQKVVNRLRMECRLSSTNLF